MKIVKIIFISLIIIAVLYMLLSRRPKPGTEKSAWESAIPKMEPVRSAISAYIINTGKLPRTLEDLIYCPEGLEESWKGPYLKLNQLFDPWGNMYILEYGYRLQSFGADGIKGGEGQNSDAEKFTELTK